MSIYYRISNLLFKHILPITFSVSINNKILGTKNKNKKKTIILLQVWWKYKDLYMYLWFSQNVYLLFIIHSFQVSDFLSKLTISKYKIYPYRIFYCYYCIIIIYIEILKTTYFVVDLRYIYYLGILLSNFTHLVFYSSLLLLLFIIII